MKLLVGFVIGFIMGVITIVQAIDGNVAWIYLKDQKISAMRYQDTLYGIDKYHSIATSADSANSGKMQRMQ